MLLCIDIGNTNIKLGLFNSDQMCCRWRISTDRSNLADEYAMLMQNLFASEDVSLQDITGCAISSVVPLLTREFETLVARYFHTKAVILGPQTLTGMPIHTAYPVEVGSDLVMNALAARHIYGTPVIVIGFGTATTFVAVSVQGDLEGVAIAPGVATSGDSLFRATSTLPQVALARPAAAIGKNTVESIQAGFIFGFVGLVKELVARMQAELGGNAHVIATGGLAELIAPETAVIDAMEPDLTLIGLRLMYEMNRPATQA
ncbi:MAG: type III pantothenate kinase, partial [Anaerolineaceae bacterium]|nr:type III pantothenate kinase [Anaerolineaceae bacterium]